MGALKKAEGKIQEMEENGLFFLSILNWLCYYSCPSFFLSFTLPPPSTLPPPYFMSMGRTYKFFGFSVPPPIYFAPNNYASYSLYLPPSHSPPPPPHWKPAMWSPFLWFCSCSSLLSFYFLGSVVDSYEFLVFYSSSFLIIFYFLDKSL